MKNIVYFPLTQSELMGSLTNSESEREYWISRIIAQRNDRIKEIVENPNQPDYNIIRHPSGREFCTMNEGDFCHSKDLCKSKLTQFDGTELNPPRCGRFAKPRKEGLLYSHSPDPDAVLEHMIYMEFEQ